jgi:polyphosphate kinase 2 (PPK2 family)
MAGVSPDSPGLLSDDSGVILLKYWLEVSETEQTRRLEARIDDGRKIWKLSPMNLKS